MIPQKRSFKYPGRAAQPGKLKRAIATAELALNAKPRSVLKTKAAVKRREAIYAHERSFVLAEDRQTRSDKQRSNSPALKLGQNRDRRQPYPVKDR